MTCTDVLIILNAFLFKRKHSVSSSSCEWNSCLTLIQTVESFGHFDHCCNGRKHCAFRQLQPYHWERRAAGKPPVTLKHVLGIWCILSNGNTAILGPKSKYISESFIHAHFPLFESVVRSLHMFILTSQNYSYTIVLYKLIQFIHTAGRQVKNEEDICSAWAEILKYTKNLFCLNWKVRFLSFSWMPCGRTQPPPRYCPSFIPEFIYISVYVSSHSRTLK